MGTASISEPHWLDQLLFNPSLEPASVERALRVCVCPRGANGAAADGGAGLGAANQHVFRRRWRAA